jgi:hypothetical protein
VNTKTLVWLAIAGLVGYAAYKKLVLKQMVLPQFGF